MAEVIKTVLTADSSELAAEFAKASAIAQKYAAEREAQGNRALASARAEVEALRLEATGHGAAAAALREKMQLTEQARRLSSQAGITEENATRILARQLELKKQLVTSAAAQVAAEQRAARIAAPGRNGIALPELALTSANLQAMEKGAARAKELRRQLDRTGRGGQNAGMGMLAFSQGMEDAQYGIRGVLNNIPQMIMSFGGPAGLAAGISMAAVAAVVLYEPMKRLVGIMDSEADSESMKNWAEAARAAADAISKLRQESSQAESIARLSEAINETLRQRIQLQDVSMNYFMEQGKKQSKELEDAKRLLDARQALAEARGETVPGRSANTEHETIASQLENRRKLLKAAADEEMRLSGVVGNISSESSAQAAASTKRLLELREELASVTESLAAGGKDLALAEKNKAGFFDHTLRYGLAAVTYNPVAAAATGTSYSPKKQEEIEKATLKNLKENQEARNKVKARIEEQIAMLEKEKGVIGESSAQSVEAANAKLTALRTTMQATADEIAMLESRHAIEKQLADLEEARTKAIRARAEKEWQAQLDIQRALAANDQERARELERQRDIEAEKRRIMAEQKGISEELAGKKAAEMVDTRADAAAAGAKATAAEELAILRARAVGENNRAGQLRSAATMEREILAIMREQNLTREQATQQAKERQELERNQARGDIMGELKALKMEAGGDKAGADRLREEMRIRQDAVALAERLGISETQAQNILREKARLQKEIAGREKNGRGDSEHQRVRSRIYIKTADEPRLTRDNLMNDGFTGLRRHELQRRSTERGNRPAKPSDDPAKNLLKSVNIQEEMLKIWQKLNVV